MLGPDGQQELLRRLAEAAARRGLLVAPVGSVFFLHRGRRSLLTKDLDAVVTTLDGEPVSLAELEAIARDLGPATTASDEATVTVAIPGLAEAEVDLLRGKEGAKRGFLPRGLLREAAQRGTVEGSILWYPVEYVVVLKADAAVDRAQRAEKGGAFAEANLARARDFRNDVVAQVDEALERGALRPAYLADAVRHLKAKRRADVVRLLEFAAAGRFALEGL